MPVWKSEFWLPDWFIRRTPSLVDAQAWKTSRLDVGEEMIRYEGEVDSFRWSYWRLLNTTGWEVLPSP